MNSIRKVVKFAYSGPYRREKIIAAPYKGFCKKLRASNILMQENYMRNYLIFLVLSGS